MFDEAVESAAAIENTLPASANCSFGTRQRCETSMVQINIPCLISYVSVVRQAVSALAEILLFSPEDCSAIKLAVGEACNNAVLYSAPLPDGSLPQVILVCEVSPEALDIKITNQGENFLPVPSAKMPEPDALSEHGRGMALMELMMDQVEYSCGGDNTTTVRLRKNRRNPPPP